MICQRMMVRGVKGVPETWQFTVNTEATAVGEKKTGIPFNLYGQDSVTLTVDWGDGTTSTLSSADYTASDSMASVHEYETAGVYTVAINSKQWGKSYLLVINSATDITTINNAVAPLYYWRRTLVSVDEILPNVAGRNYYNAPTNVSSLFKTENNLSYLFFSCKNCTTIPSGLFDNNVAVTSLSSCFYGCLSLSTIPSGLFDNNTIVTNFAFCFYNCSSLTAIPSGLFNNNVAVTNFDYCFYNWSYLTDFTIRIRSSQVASASNFAIQRTGTTRIIYVPSGSTTETTFNAVASSLGLTIIGE